MPTAPSQHHRNPLQTGVRKRTVRFFGRGAPRPSPRFSAGITSDFIPFVPKVQPRDEGFTLGGSAAAPCGFSRVRAHRAGSGSPLPSGPGVPGGLPMMHPVLRLGSHGSPDLPAQLPRGVSCYGSTPHGVRELRARLPTASRRRGSTPHGVLALPMACAPWGVPTRLHPLRNRRYQPPAKGGRNSTVAPGGTRNEARSAEPAGRSPTSTEQTSSTLRSRSRPGSWSRTRPTSVSRFTSPGTRTATSGTPAAARAEAQKRTQISPSAAASGSGG